MTTTSRRGDASPGLVLVIVCAGVVLASLDLGADVAADPVTAYQRALGVVAAGPRQG